jgi:hypothetical protein
MTDQAPPGSISLCPHNDCGFICCDFAAGNFIVLHPGEVEQARQRGESLAHLEISEGHLGGHKAICRARDTGTCDNGYKPLDCACYPFFPTIGDGDEIEAGIKGAKCPLQVSHLTEHRFWVIRAWNRVAERFDGVVEWIRQTRLVGYERVNELTEEKPAEPPAELVSLELLGDLPTQRRQS